MEWMFPDTYLFIYILPNPLSLSTEMLRDYILSLQLWTLNPSVPAPRSMLSFVDTGGAQSLKHGSSEVVYNAGWP